MQMEVLHSWAKERQDGGWDFTSSFSTAQSHFAEEGVQPLCSILTYPTQALQDLIICLPVIYAAHRHSTQFTTMSDLQQNGCSPSFARNVQICTKPDILP